MPKYAKCDECGQECDTKGSPHEDFCEGRPAGIRVLADLERRIVALEDAAEARSVELAEVVARSDRANVERREALGLLVDLAAPARKVVAFVDGNPTTEDHLFVECVRSAPIASHIRGAISEAKCAVGQKATVKT